MSRYNVATVSYMNPDKAPDEIRNWVSLEYIGGHAVFFMDRQKDMRNMVSINMAIISEIVTQPEEF